MTVRTFCHIIAILLSADGFAASESHSVVCERPAPGTTVNAASELYSANGVLKTKLSFRGETGPDGIRRYCYVYEDSVQAPTLRLKPGDGLVLTLKNDLAPVASTPAGHQHQGCSGGEMTASSTNLHFHGLHVPPTCHQDDVIHTLVQPDTEGFEYHIHIPASQPPGLYWYHPHPHGFSERQVLGGASGALIVDGIEGVRPDVAGLAERVLVLRDQTVLGQRTDSDEAGAPGKDISLNFVPIVAPLYLPAVMRVPPMRREFWRVLNAAADTYFDLQLVYRLGNPVENVPQVLEFVALDGAPIDGGRTPQATHVLLPPGARAEFIVTTPPAGAFAQLVTRDYDTGPDGEKRPYRAIANIISRIDAPPVPLMPAFTGSRARPSSVLGSLRPVRTRKLYFSESRQHPTDPVNYYIAVDGAEPKIFDMNFSRPDVTVEQGSIEDWTIENRSREAHAFHIHQLHFQLIERDGYRVNDDMLRDTIDLPYWDGKSQQYPSVKLRMDFRSPDIVGTFLYHCHILEHEDGGMMGSIQVVPANVSKSKRNIHTSANTQ